MRPKRINGTKESCYCRKLFKVDNTVQDFLFHISEHSSRAFLSLFLLLYAERSTQFSSYVNEEKEEEGMLRRSTRGVVLMGEIGF